MPKGIYSRKNKFTKEEKKPDIGNSPQNGAVNLAVVY
jgi:hypothetical protein